MDMFHLCGQKLADKVDAGYGRVCRISACRPSDGLLAMLVMLVRPPALRRSFSGGSAGITADRLTGSGPRYNLGVNNIKLPRKIKL